jgi:hypothetical protein
MSRGLSPGGWLAPRCVNGRCDESEVEDELEGGGRECDRAERASERSENRWSSSASAVLVVCTAELTYEKRLSILN